MIFKKYFEIPYKWLVIKGEREVAHFHTPVFEDMFWRSVTMEPLVEDIDIYDDNYWIDCKYKVKHYEKDYYVDYPMIVAHKEEEKVVIRGVPELVHRKVWEKIFKENRRTSGYCD